MRQSRFATSTARLPEPSRNPAEIGWRSRICPRRAAGPQGSVRAQSAEAGEPPWPEWAGRTGCQNPDLRRSRRAPHPGPTGNRVARPAACHRADRRGPGYRSPILPPVFPARPEIRITNTRQAKARSPPWRQSAGRATIVPPQIYRLPPNKRGRLSPDEPLVANLPAPRQHRR